MVTGQAGMGKTTAIRTFVRGLPANLYQVIYLGQDQRVCPLNHVVAACHVKLIS
jgi:tRNA uridine 5-carbamoylmethylation protein Kti12